LDGDVLQRGSVVLNAIDGVTGSVAIMEGEGQSLYMVQELSPEVPNQFFPGIGLQPPAQQPLQVYENRQCYQEADGESQSGAVRIAGRQEALQGGRQCRLPHETVYSNLQRDWREQRQG
jgi:hypothetical protein